MVTRDHLFFSEGKRIGGVKGRRVEEGWSWGEENLGGGETGGSCKFREGRADPHGYHHIGKEGIVWADAQTKGAKSGGWGVGPGEDVSDKGGRWHWGTIPETDD